MIIFRLIRPLDATCSMPSSLAGLAFSLSLIDGRVDAKGMWSAVRQLTGRQQDTPEVDGVTAESLNEHYAAISTDSNYQAPARKQSVAQSQSNLPNMELISEWRMLQLLDKLRPTAAGFDQLPIPLSWSTGLVQAADTSLQLV